MYIRLPSAKHAYGTPEFSAYVPGERRHAPKTTVVRLYRPHDRKVIDEIERVGGPLHDLEVVARLYCEQKDDGSAMPVFAPGEMRRLNVVGMPIFLDKLLEGDFFGEISALRGVPRTANVRAIGDVELLCFDRDHVLDLVRHEPRLAEALERAATQRSENSQAAINDNYELLRRL